MGAASGTGQPNLQRTASGSKKNLNVVVIGETGSGKTSLLNLIGNMTQIKEVLASGKELKMSDVKHLHASAQTDGNVGQGQSQTECAFPHTIDFPNVQVVMIDTPGLGDTRGLEQDRKSVQHIQNTIRAAGEGINCVVLVVNGRETRVTPQFRFVLSQVTLLLPKQILNQLIVVCTKVNDPMDLNFDPRTLGEFLGKTPPDTHIGLVDNPYARVARLKAREQDLSNVKIAKSLKMLLNDFESTYEDFDDIFKRILAFPPVALDEFARVFDARQKIEELVRLKHCGEQLRDNLLCFSESSIASSFVKIMNEQLSFLEFLMEDAKAANSMDVIEMLSKQITEINLMKASVDKVGGR